MDKVSEYQSFLDYDGSSDEEVPPPQPPPPPPTKEELEEINRKWENWSNSFAIRHTEPKVTFTSDEKLITIIPDKEKIDKTAKGSIGAACGKEEQKSSVTYTSISTSSNNSNLEKTIKSQTPKRHNSSSYINIAEIARNATQKGKEKRSTSNPIKCHKSCPQTNLAQLLRNGTQKADDKQSSASPIKCHKSSPETNLSKWLQTPSGNGKNGIPANKVHESCSLVNLTRLIQATTENEKISDKPTPFVKCHKSRSLTNLAQLLHNPIGNGKAIDTNHSDVENGEKKHRCMTAFSTLDSPYAKSITSSLKKNLGKQGNRGAKLSKPSAKINVVEKLPTPNEIGKRKVSSGALKIKPTTTVTKSLIPKTASNSISLNPWGQMGKPKNLSQMISEARKEVLIPSTNFRSKQRSLFMKKQVFGLYNALDAASVFKYIPKESPRFPRGTVDECTNRLLRGHFKKEGKKKAHPPMHRLEDSLKIYTNGSTTSGNKGKSRPVTAFPKLI